LTYSREVENQSFLDARIFIDTINGLSGTIYPRGSLANPVSNYSDALIIREQRGLSQRYLLSGALSISNSPIEQSLQGNDWKGVNSILADFTLNGNNTLNTVFTNLTISGTYNGHCHIQECVVNGGTDFEADVGNSGLKGTITLPSAPTNTSYVIHDCYSLVAGTGSPILDCNSATNLDVSIRNYSGAIEIRNFVSGNMSIDLDSGSIVVAASCTGGTLVITGTGAITDNSNGTTVVTSSLLSGSDIAASVWDEDLSLHNTLGTTGERLNDLDTTYIQSAVWDANTSSHDTSGTFGGDIATKADVQSVASTEEVNYTSGSIIFGTLGSGTIASTLLRDNNYWVIDEHATNGITVEYVFNLTDSEHRAGAFLAFGRYDGGGNPSHYVELWAYNYEATAWELLHEIFMDNATTDDEYSHAYSERHIDRDNNNEVKFRLIHNATTYNAGHSLYLDNVYITTTVREHHLEFSDIIAANLITK